MAKKTARTTTPSPQPTAKSSPRTSHTGTAPAPDESSGTTFAKFLKTSDIGAVGDSASLQLLGEARLVDGNYGEQIVMSVRHQAETYDWGVGVNSVNHRLLFERFGKRFADWRGKVTVAVKMSRQDRPYLAVTR